MAIVTTSFQSEELMRMVTFSAIIPTHVKSYYDPEAKVKPENKPLKTLYLLHGWNGNHEDWIQKTTIIELANQYNLAVIMPSGENSFYVDHPSADNYGKFIGEELVEVTRDLFPLSHKREDTFIGGLSMGGYGALRNGFKYDQTFSKVVAQSSRILHKKDPYHDLVEDNPINRRIWHLLSSKSYADLTNDMDIYSLIKESENKPALFLTCGTEDHLYSENKDLHDWLETQKITHLYSEKPGDHSWPFWENAIKEAIPWMLDHVK